MNVRRILKQLWLRAVLPMQITCTLVACTLLACALMACTAPATDTPPTETDIPAPSSPEGQVIVLGDISDDPGEVIEGSQPLANYLAAHLADQGISEGQVKIAADTDEMIQLLKDGKIDLYFDSIYPATLISDASGAQPFLRRWRYGVETYYTVIFASAESGITEIEDLAGHMIAFDNPFSTSGYLMPAVYLREHGLKLVGKQSYEDPVAEDEVGFVYSYDDENTLQWVLSGRIAAGATDDYYYANLFPDEARENLIVLTETDPVPRQVVVARPGMDPDLLAAIKDVLLTIHEDPEAQTALEAFSATSRFDEFPEGIENAQRRMREMMDIAQGIPQP